MTDPLAPLVIDFLDWLDCEPWTYADIMDAWRTSCPRLTVWEDAIDSGLVCRERRGGVTLVVVTNAGRRLSLERRRRVSAHTCTDTLIQRERDLSSC